MRRPKSCNGCKAFYQSQWRHKCELGYEMGQKKIGSFQGADILIFYPVKGQCPKPKTLAELMTSPKAWDMPHDVDTEKRGDNDGK